MVIRVSETASSTTASFLGASASRAVAFARNWWVIGLRGGFAILFGIVAIILPVPTLGTLLLVFAAYLVVDGVASVFSGLESVLRHKRWGLLITEGVLDLALAGLILFAPIATIIAFVYLAAAWAVITGAMLAVAAVGFVEGHGRVWMALAGVLSALWGMALFGWPAAGALVLTWWLAAYASMFGTALVVLSLRLRQHDRDVKDPGGRV